jgi:hypothetical protein
MRTVNLVFPVRNDECLLIRGIRRTSDFCEEYFPGRYRITIADCGSSDGTERMGRDLAACCANVDFLSAVPVVPAVLQANPCDIVGFLDIDLSAGLEHLLYIDRLLEDGAACVVNGSRFRTFSVIRAQRPLWKNALDFQSALRFLFRFHSGDALCRFKFFRRETAEELLPFCGDAPCWYTCAELLLRAERAGIPARELAVDWMEPRTLSAEEIRQQRGEFWREAGRLWVRLLRERL